MKNLLLFLGITVSLFFKAQTLTNQMAFDFNVGDVIYKQYSCSNAFFAFDSVITKNYSATNDTIFYFFNRVGYTANVSQQTITINTSTYSLLVTNLNSQVTIPAQIYQDTVKTDTTYFGYCGKKVYGYKYKCVTPCPLLSINESHNFYWFIEGLGGPYKSSYITGSQPGTSACSYLAGVLYYKKGALECGVRPTVGIKENSLQNQNITVYPNPANDEISITFSAQFEDHLYLEWFDVTGNKIQENKMTKPYKMNVKDISNGIYFLKISGVGFTFYKKICIQ